jgi:hypothetical protein
MPPVATGRRFHFPNWFAAASFLDLGSLDER